MNIAHYALPQKTRELHNHHFDSTIWNDFRFRSDDIVIATHAKSGTTTECAAYERTALDELGAECAAWLVAGSHGLGTRAAA
jgi:hypothetical protein